MRKVVIRIITLRLIFSTFDPSSPSDGLGLDVVVQITTIGNNMITAGLERFSDFFRSFAARVWHDATSVFSSEMPNFHSKKYVFATYAVVVLSTEVKIICVVLENSHFTISFFSFFFLAAAAVFTLFSIYITILVSLSSAFLTPHVYPSSLCQ